MKDKKIVILGGRVKSTNIIYNLIKSEFNIERVILEKHIPLVRFFRRRIKTLGFFKVIGQIGFLILIIPFLKQKSRKRIKEIKEKYNFNEDVIDKSKMIRLESVNSYETIKILKDIRPSLVIINGTRIISEIVLNCVSAKFINTHAGITPLYRGLHGGYWALVDNNKKQCGVTVHLVDPGIDTGNILKQGIINPSIDDNFVTYPLLQLAKGIALLKMAIKDVLNNRLIIQPNQKGLSKFWSHPSLWEYLLNKIIYKVK